MNICQSCGKDNREEASFCRFCGQPLAVAEEAGSGMGHDFDSPPLQDEKATLQFIEKPDLLETIALDPEDVDPAFSPGAPSEQTESQEMPDIGAAPAPTGFETIQVEMNLPGAAQDFETVILEPEIEIQNPGLQEGLPDIQTEEVPPLPGEPSGFETVILESGFEIEEGAAPEEGQEEEAPVGSSFPLRSHPLG